MWNNGARADFFDASQLATDSNDMDPVAATAVLKEKYDCDGEQGTTAYGVVDWPTTSKGKTARIKCPSGYSGDLSRYCSLSNGWSSPRGSCDKINANSDANGQTVRKRIDDIEKRTEERNQGKKEVIRRRRVKIPRIFLKGADAENRLNAPQQEEKKKSEEKVREQKPQRVAYSVRFKAHSKKSPWGLELNFPHFKNMNSWEVTRVEPKKQADKNGVQAGDTLVTIDGKPIDVKTRDADEERLRKGIASELGFVRDDDEENEEDDAGPLEHQDTLSFTKKYVIISLEWTKKFQLYETSDLVAAQNKFDSTSDRVWFENEGFENEESGWTEKRLGGTGKIGAIRRKFKELLDGRNRRL